MAALLHQRCFHHAAREAVARCPACRRFYCRECITEHEDRVVCADCLRQGTAPTAARAPLGTVLFTAAQCVTGIFLLWIFFYCWGELLLSIPSSFHEGSVWLDRWWKEP